MTCDRCVRAPDHLTFCTVTSGKRHFCFITEVKMIFGALLLSRHICLLSEEKKLTPSSAFSVQPSNIKNSLCAVQKNLLRDVVRGKNKLTKRILIHKPFSHRILLRRQKNEALRQKIRINPRIIGHHLHHHHHITRKTSTAL